MAPARFDFIIVGGGSAGCALANRLSADPGTSVLVLEAGRPDYRFDVFVHMPSALTFPIGSRYYDWGYESEPEPFMGGRRIYHARGRILGGSSSINGQIFQRGNPLDYERWAADPGMETWDYAHCLPYFKKMETCLAAAPDDPWRGHDGPLVLERGPATNPLFTAFFAACQEAGYDPDRGRQRLSPGGLRAVRPEHPRRAAAVRVAGLPEAGPVLYFADSLVSLAIAMSQAHTRPAPPPNAEPLTLAIVGTSMLSRAWNMAESFSASARFCSREYWPMRFIQFRSAPAQKDLPAPVMTTRPGGWAYA